MRHPSPLIVLVLIGACRSVPQPPLREPLAELESPVDQAKRETRDQLTRIAIALEYDRGRPDAVEYVIRRLGTSGWELAHRDPWGTPMWLDARDQTLLRVRSSGADRLAGTDDDIIASLEKPNSGP